MRLKRAPSLSIFLAVAITLFGPRSLPAAESASVNPVFSPDRGEVILAQRALAPAAIPSASIFGRNPWSLLRSAAVPGWGQLCDGKSLRGLFLMTLWTGAATGLVFIYDDYDKKLGEYDDAIIAYRTADFINVEARRELMRDKHDDADRAFQNARMLAAATAGIWGLAMLDWLIFAPPTGRLGEIDGDRGRLKLAVRPGTINRVGIDVAF